MQLMHSRKSPRFWHKKRFSKSVTLCYNCCDVWDENWRYEKVNRWPVALFLWKPCMALLWEWRGCRGLDPFEDTERYLAISLKAVIRSGCRGLDPFEDTESPKMGASRRSGNARCRGLDPFEDTERLHIAPSC